MRARWMSLIAAVLVLASFGWGVAHEPDPSTSSGAGHEAFEGAVLGPSQPSARRVAAACPAQAPVREYGVVALAVEVTLNRFLDFDPLGRMYALESEVQRVRDEEARNRLARSEGTEPAVSIGLQGDAIQPLVVRVNQGECLRIHLRNEMGDELAGIEVHGVQLYLPEASRVARAADAASLARPGDSVTYEWWVSAEEPEATHYFHSHGEARRQTAHGLFGAIIVEPAGARYLDPVDGRPVLSGWDAMIVLQSGESFREFVFMYHEIGNERYRILDRRGAFVPQVDPYTTAYRPGARAINYRSEPFMNRMRLMQEQGIRYDESLAYSSYAFGDPATPVARSYVGDPVKQRLVHGGSEVFHVHHVHGGAIRWPRQPGLEAERVAAGLDKQPALLTTSERLDAQTIGPSETYDLESECGSGGCQQGVGDFLIHCHIAHHYFAGMWTIWRVYNTLQQEGGTQDALPPLRELPGREGTVRAAVTSAELVGTTVDWYGLEFSITANGLGEWVERQLPPSGDGGPDDASVFDWQRAGDLYLNEPESIEAWPGHVPTSGGDRRPLPFDPKTGKLAFPWLRPHLGVRPPFAPNHGPAPYLDPIARGVDPPLPGANGPGSVCPEGTRRQGFTVHAISLPVVLNEREGIVDPVGQLFVLKEEEERVRADPSARVPLVIRANAGEDCIDVVFKSSLPDTRENGFHSKANMHIHFVQFDVQASDGLTAGYNFEQSVRPFTVEGERLTREHHPGGTVLELANATRFQRGALVGVGMDEVLSFEVHRVAEVHPWGVVLETPLRYAHGEGEIVSSEFVRYRWYPDVQFGTAYFHDHVLALSSWRHGLFGALVSEPPGSTYHHPDTGEPIASGPIADIHTSARVSVDVEGSFRELVLLIQDGNPLTASRNTTGGSFNLRVEPLAARGGAGHAFDSALHGDPATPVLAARLGDPVVLRALVGAANEVHTLGIDGHWFRLEPQNADSSPIGVARIGISERADLVVPRAGGPQQAPGDYLIRSGRLSKFGEGLWALLRVLDEGAEGAPRPLPGVEGTRSGGSSGLCPPSAPVAPFHLVAIEAPLPMLAGASGSILVDAAEAVAVVAGERAAEPWVGHVNVGDCVRIELTNALPDAPVALRVGMLAGDPAEGPPIGRNGGRVVMPGRTTAYTFFAHPEVGETVALVTGAGDPLDQPRRGLYGAVIVHPSGSRYSDPVSGVGVSSGWRVDVHPPTGLPYRSFALFLQEEDPVIGTSVMPYTEHVQGVVGLNYARASTPGIRGASGDATGTPLLEAFVGDEMRVHVMMPSGEQMHVFAIEGHRWPLEPGYPGSTLVASQAVGPLEAYTLRFRAGSGGDYLYGDHRGPYADAGLWGVLRVHVPTDGGAGIRPIAEQHHGHPRRARP